MSMYASVAVFYDFGETLPERGDFYLVQNVAHKCDGKHQLSLYSRYSSLLEVKRELRRLVRLWSYHASNGRHRRKSQAVALSTFSPSLRAGDFGCFDKLLSFGHPVPYIIPEKLPRAVSLTVCT